MIKQEVRYSANGLCAEKNTQQAVAFRIQKRNNKDRKFAFIVHPECLSLFERVIDRQVSQGRHTLLYVSGEGFVEIDRLFVMEPPDFLTFICPASSNSQEKFNLLVSKIDRWMSDRFITTIISTQSARQDSMLASLSKQDLAQKLRKISSQLVWVDDEIDLSAILSALRFQK